MEFDIGARTSLKRFRKPHRANRDVCLFVSTGTNKHKPLSGICLRQRSRESRNETIVQTIAGTQRNVGLEEFGAADKCVQREHSRIRVPRQDSILPHRIFRCNLGYEFIRQKSKKASDGPSAN